MFYLEVKKGRQLVLKYLVCVSSKYHRDMKEADVGCDVMLIPRKRLKLPCIRSGNRPAVAFRSFPTAPKRGDALHLQLHHHLPLMILSERTFLYLPR